MSALELEEAIDFGLGADWGLHRDGRATRTATVEARAVRFTLDTPRPDTASALDIALAGRLDADQVSELSSWARSGSRSTRRIDQIGLEASFEGEDEAVEIAVDAAIDRVIGILAIRQALTDAARRVFAS